MSPMDKEIQRRLLDFYKKKSASWESINIPDLAKISDGWENEVYSFTIGYKKNIGQLHENLILRIYPGDDAPHKAAREFNGMRKLYELGFPVPEVLMLELDDSTFGKPFIIMEKIEGRSMLSVIDKSPDEKKQELIASFFKMFVDLHALDWRPFVSDPSIYETGGPYRFINNWLSRWRGHIDHFQRDEFAPVLDWLEARYSDVPCDRLSVIHFDYHPNNVLMRDDGRAFIIDWTCMEVADFRLDLAWTIVLADSELRELILSEYERVACRRIEQIEYFEVAACLRRLFSISVSLSDGAAKLGMRPEAVAMMKKNVSHIKNVYALL